MADSSIRTALSRVENAFAQKPSLALQPDSPAHAVYQGGLATEIRHPHGHTISTDMPKAMGGGGEKVAPGWLLRAGLASCTATVIALRAEQLGMQLSRLEVQVGSQSDTRGLLGTDPSIVAGPLQMTMQIDIAADGVDAQALAELVAWGEQHSPIGDALRRPIEVRLTINGKPVVH
jgi:uncharacterized OsmC-like protein